MNHSYIGTEHLFLGLLAEGRGIGGQVLGEAGVTLDAARSELLRVLGAMEATTLPPPGWARPAADQQAQQLGHLSSRALDHVEVILHYRDGGRFQGSFGSAADAASFLHSVRPPRGRR